jgi:hypothetical protein
MAQTIQQLIDGLQRIEDKSQIFIGDIWIAEDFTYETKDGEEKFFTPEQLEKVSNYRSIGKSMGYFYDEICNHLHEALSEEEK